MYLIDENYDPIIYPTDQLCKEKCLEYVECIRFTTKNYSFIFHEYIGPRILPNIQDFEWNNPETTVGQITGGDDWGRENGFTCYAKQNDCFKLI